LGMTPICLHPKQPPRPFSLPHIHSFSSARLLCTDRVFGHGPSLWSRTESLVIHVSDRSHDVKRDLLQWQKRPIRVSNET
jgi:hypothetical protein